MRDQDDPSPTRTKRDELQPTTPILLRRRPARQRHLGRRARLREHRERMEDLSGYNAIAKQNEDGSSEELAEEVRHGIAPLIPQLPADFKPTSQSLSIRRE